MIRHAFLRSPPPVFTLAFAMVLPRFGAIAVAAIGAAMLIEPGLSTANRAAIALATVTAGADKELGLAFAAATNPPPESDFAMTGHPASQAGLDNGDGFVAP